MQASDFLRQFQSDGSGRTYSEMTRSDHSTRDTKMAGLPNFAFQTARSFSETRRARKSPSSKDRNVFGDDLVAQLAEWRPANGNHRVRSGFAHQIRRVSRQKYLDFVAGLRQRQCMREHE